MSQSTSYQNFKSHSEALPFALGLNRVSGVLREKDEDFKVFEHLSFELTGEGEHLFLLIEKENCNTEWVAKQLQKSFNIDSKAMGYAGKKDRHSVSRQWFSVQLPGIIFDEAEIREKVDNDQFRLVEFSRHNKKLRRGAIAFNHFEILITQVKGELDANSELSLRDNGFPNYFGYQRFGIDSSNLPKAEKMLKSEIKVKSRDKKSMLISASRSFLFNLQLAKRVEDKSWNKALEGDCFNLQGSKSYFSAQEGEFGLQSRLDSNDIHVSGWLPGNQKSEASSVALQSETDSISLFDAWFDGFKKHRIDSARRAFRVVPDKLKITQESDAIRLSFNLPTGAFATSLIREFCDIKDASVEKAKAYIAEKEREREQNVD